MKCLLILLISFGLLVCAKITNTCKPIFFPGFNDTSVCEEIYDSDHGYWLPDAYIHNAICACQKLSITSDEANCIREFLSFRLADIKRYDETFKQEFSEAKSKYKQHPAQNFIAYKTLVTKKLSPLIYQDHEEAYKQCCCTGTPAFFFTWELVSNLHSPSCNIIKSGIVLLGSCHNTPGRW